MAKTANRTTPPGTAAQTALEVVNDFENIQDPGAYVSENGILFRVFSENLKAGHSPTMGVVGVGTLTRISSDPLIPIGKARLIAANADLSANF